MVDEASGQFLVSRDFPEFRNMPDEIAAIVTDVRRMDEARRTFAGFEFDAKLPQIVGWVPAGERATFSSFVTENGFPSSGHDYLPKDADNTGVELLADEDFQEIEQLLPGTITAIKTDVQRLREGGIPGLTLDGLYGERKQTSAGSSPRDPELHLDGNVTYLISDENPTVMYQGRAKVIGDPSRKRVYFDEDSVPRDAQLHSAPKFAIVRLTPLTAHGSPVFTQDAIRTFTTFFTRRALPSV